jgi:uncharacterized cupredoxin-like copper-binding protein
MTQRDNTAASRTVACLVATALLGSGLAAGCGGDDEAAEAKTNAVSVEGTEYAFLMPDRVKGGVLTMSVSNTGRELHEYAIGRLKKGKTLEDFKRELDSGREVRSAADVAGVPGLSPGKGIAITRTLRPGRYFFLCAVPSPEGVPHYELGMLKEFDVVGRSGAELPKPDATVTAGDKVMEVPALQAGEHMLELKNAASAPREFELLELKPGSTVKDVAAFFERGRPDLKASPAIFLGAIQTVAPGESVFLEVSLNPGRRYVFQDADNGLVEEFGVS